MHRFIAAREIITRSGNEYFNGLIGAEGLACMVLKWDTPESVCAAWAAKLNNSNQDYSKMTYMDRVSF